MPETLLHTQLTEIAKLEKEHSLLGVSFMAKNNDQPIHAETVVESVRDIIDRTIEILGRRDEIQLAPQRETV